MAALRTGFLTDISNPKAAVFFGSLFSTLLPPHTPIWVLTSAVGLVLVIEFTWYCIVAWLFSLSPVAAVYRRAKPAFDRLTGGLFLLLGVRLAASE